MQERVPGQATCVPGGIVLPTVATYGVAAGVAEVGVVDAKLGMVEQIEGLDAKLKVAPFGYFEVLQRRYIKVQASRVVHKVPSRIPEGESLRSDKGDGIAQDRTNTLRIVRPCGRGRVRVANDIRIRSSACPVGYASVVKN